MKRIVLYVIVCAVALCSCSSASNQGKVVPVDVLDIEFISKTALKYENKSFYRKKMNGVPAFNWSLNRDFLSYIGKVKITEMLRKIEGRNNWNGYCEVKASIDEDGDIAILVVPTGYMWIADNKIVSIFDAEFMDLYGGSFERSNENTIIEKPFRLCEISDVDHCIPFTGRTALWDTDTTLFAYSQDAPGLVYKFRIYKDADNDRCYLGCSGDHVTYYLIEITDNTLLSYLGQ